MESQERSSGMQALIIGYGASGRAADALLRARGAATVVLSDDRRDALGEGRFDVAVVSPGIALTHPWVVTAQRRGIPLKSELQLGCEELRRRGWKLLAVTGSKGKSSVVKVVADGLCRAGVRAVACGNYGRPVCDLVREEPGWAVVEVSSFMLETTVLPADTFEAAAILNLQEDHLDRHGSVAVYHALKRRLLSFAKADVSPRDETGAQDAALLADSYFDNAILCANGCVAVRLMRAAGLGDDAIRQAFRTFAPLPHRFQEVATLDGVRYVDDSKATSVAALVAGVTMCRETEAEPSVRLIAGGLPKGDDPKIACSALTSRVKKVYLIGQSAGLFLKVWSDAVDCEICGTLERAVQAARRESARGETVLLSPGAASFDQFNSFGERGEVFASLVKRERKNR